MLSAYLWTIGTSAQVAIGLATETAQSMRFLAFS